MVEDKVLLEDFAEQVRVKFPEYSSYLTPIPTKYSHGTYYSDDTYNESLLIPWPIDSKRCHLSVYFRTYCFEIAFSIDGTRGPAESQIYGKPNGDSQTMVQDTILFLEDFFSEKIVVAVNRYRWLWFSPYYLPFFRSLSDRPFGHRVSEVLSWRGTYNERRLT